MPTLKVAWGLRCQLLTCPFSLGLIPDSTDQSRWRFRAYEAPSSHVGRWRRRDGDGEQSTGVCHLLGHRHRTARGVSAPEASADEEAVVRKGLLAAQVCAQLWPHRPCGLRAALGCVGPSASGGEECSLCRDHLG